VWAGDRLGLQIAGGTSASAPFWAGITALAKQYVRERGGQILADGDLKSLLYEIASRPDLYQAVFRDITTGRNQVFAASPGWDFITGLGTPHVAELARTWEVLSRSAPTIPSGRIEGPDECAPRDRDCTVVAVVRTGQSGVWSSDCGRPSGEWPDNHFYELTPALSEAGGQCRIRLELVNPAGEPVVLEHTVTFTSE
jgi:hypothetical protein